MMELKASRCECSTACIVPYHFHGFSSGYTDIYAWMHSGQPWLGSV